ncbi:iron-sulfur cluster assembly scaffold protein [Gammaproteobacteria bacterium]|nr:iron-sulfur cluster assembly scaffold protein [Gammaproteobacteria bacterium]
MNALYEQMIIHHSRTPFGQQDVLKGAFAKGSNPLCGDEIACAVHVNDEKLAVRHQTKGCSLSIASASIMAKVLEGKSLVEFTKLYEQFMHAALTEELFIGKFACFNGVKAFPMRIKCITFPWHATMQAIKQLSYPLQLEQSAIEYWSDLVKQQMAVGIDIDFKQIGCYGWKFDAAVVRKHMKNKSYFEYGEWKMYLDGAILDLVAGTKVIYEGKDPLSKKIIYQHPKASSMCGCGESIFIDE